ncbi:uncharacterized protein PAC_04634 [Phialocephala subalpina]|uniref:Uncharacterized protein n=1 Tax=Phialocephala subalpina TaxID=576137 RepID=A0A1L7WPP9_9HELO|nr:uncharacterized protein PAC_04634 [Phialocephala subalpina]
MEQPTNSDSPPPIPPRNPLRLSQEPKPPIPPRNPQRLGQQLSSPIPKSPEPKDHECEFAGVDDSSLLGLGQDRLDTVKERRMVEETEKKVLTEKVDGLMVGDEKKKKMEDGDGYVVDKEPEDDSVDK